MKEAHRSRVPEVNAPSEITQHGCKLNKATDYVSGSLLNVLYMTYPKKAIDRFTFLANAMG